MLGDGKQQLAPKQNVETVLLLAERYTRAQMAMEPWATRGKQCVEFTEGKQWGAEDLQELEDTGRPGLTINKIIPLVRLVLGYHRNNRTDLRYLPGTDGSGDAQVGEYLTLIAKNISENNQVPYIDAEVFLDGIVTGRGYYDTRLKWEENLYGEIDVKAKDPFSIKLDPDADQYDLNSGSFVMEDRWVSYDEVEYTYGPNAAALIKPLVYRSGYAGMPSSNMMELYEEITPWRTFGGDYDSATNYYMAVESYLAQAYDPMRKNIRLVDCQHYVRSKMRYMVDLETGQKYPIPDHYDTEKIRKVLAWAEEQYWLKGKVSPIRYAERMGRRCRWTTMIGDIIVYDDWSLYPTFTLTPFFPYFRRGQTKGMVDDLIDPQREVNKRRSAETDVVTRTAHSGWIYHEQGLKETEKEKLEQYGAAPGINIEWKGEQHHKPTKIDAGQMPVALERLEDKSSDNLKEISSLNDSILGELDRVQSGVAVEARQRQGVIGIQTYMDNNSRTIELRGRKTLEIIQQHYTEPRVFNIVGDDGKPTQFTINQRDKAVGRIINDVTIGKYRIAIDETPLSKSYMAAQFEELMQLIEKQILPLPVVQDIAIDVSSVPQKETVKQRVQALMKAQGIPTGDDLLDMAPGSIPQILGPDGRPVAGQGQPPAGEQPLVEDGQGNVITPRQ